MFENKQETRESTQEASKIFANKATQSKGHVLHSTDLQCWLNLIFSEKFHCLINPLIPESDWHFIFRSISPMNQTFKS